MKQRIILLCALIWMACQMPVAWADNTSQAQKTFCAVSDFFGQNKALDTTRSTITYSLTLFGGTLAALVNIEAQRANLEKGLTASSISLRALSWAGPLKAFGRAVIPLMDNTNKVIKSAKLNSRTAQLYKKVYTPLSYAWLAINGAMYGVQVAGVFVCKRAKIMGLTITRKGTKDAATKFWSLSQRYGSKINQSVSRLNSAKNTINRHKGTFSSMNSLRSVQGPLKSLLQGLKKTNQAMKPVFVASRALVKEMNKRRCITYGVKVKVKVKVKKKFWKTKVKTKAKTVKFCFRISKVAGQIDKLAKVVQKPVNDVINKAIKPLMNEIKKGLRKGLKLNRLTQYQRQIQSLGQKLTSMTGSLGSLGSQLSSDKNTLNQIGGALR